MDTDEINLLMFTTTETTFTTVLTTFTTVLTTFTTKSDVFLFRASQQLKTMSGLTSVRKADSVIHFSDSIKILSITLDSNGFLYKSNIQVLFLPYTFHQIRGAQTVAHRRPPED